MFLFKVVSEFEVTRRVLVDLEGISLRRKWLSGLEPENVHMMIGNLNGWLRCVNNQFLPSFLPSVIPDVYTSFAGSMTIDCLGILTELSDCKRKLFPVGYQ